MRTAVVRVGVDTAGTLSAERLAAGMRRLCELAAELGAEVVDADLAAQPPHRREVEVLLTGDDPDALTETAMRLCAKAFDVTPVPGVVTYVSRGTDDDAHGVLAAFGLRGEIERQPGEDGWDIVHVRLRREDLRRVPESRIHTALEASLNCEVHIHAV
ncbi:hypothetical protein [uncultured Mycolicibacterium sp.]|mgnify:FL=1|uniref:hypothetical protein n=1 Tax=uncultured Mycolicibacterium sp. TaxID=2320817 RepID=UPI00261EA252|nr:hypothetical protein [uncultured Mycolicibacterium sp.]